MNRTKTYPIQFFHNPGRSFFCHFHRVLYSFVAVFSVACLPALSFSCAKAEPPVETGAEERDGNRTETLIRVTGAGRSFNINRCDVLVYDDDVFGRLDSYSSFTGSPETLKVSSGSGGKRLAVLCNLPDGQPEWPDVLSFRSLSGLSSLLENEAEDSPVLVGLAQVKAGDDCEVELRPLTAKVRLKELCCDFRGTAYQFEELTDIRVYLVNVNAECGLTGSSSVGRRFINNGAWTEGDALGFRSPEIICREVDGSVGMDPVRLDLGLLCYPNDTVEESFGRPFTRLVVEGRIKGRKWYWPVNVNPIGENGIASAECYNISLTLRRSGTDDPDTAIGIEEAGIKMEIERWNEKENCTIVY